MKNIWVVSVHDQWKGLSWVAGVFSSWDQALAYAKRKYPRCDNGETDTVHEYDADIERFVVDEHA